LRKKRVYSIAKVGLFGIRSDVSAEGVDNPEGVLEGRRVIVNEVFAGARAAGLSVHATSIITAESQVEKNLVAVKVLGHVTRVGVELDRGGAPSIGVDSALACADVVGNVAVARPKPNGDTVASLLHGVPSSALGVEARAVVTRARKSSAAPASRTVDVGVALE